MPNTPDIDVSALAEALNEKLDRDGGNATNAIKEMMAHMGMPSDRYIDLTLPASGGRVTAPADGWMSLRAAVAAGGWWVMSSNGILVRVTNNTGNSALGDYLPVNKNAKVDIVYNNISDTTLRFHYANGSVTA